MTGLDLTFSKHGRVGRVNRVGTEHKKVFIFNFIPTAQSDMHLGLEARETEEGD